MWTILGLVRLVVACAVAWFLRGRPWRGKPRGGYFVDESNNKGSLVALAIGVPVRTALEFELKREGWIDRAAKAIGLSVEAQLGRPRIDDALYLVADEPRVASALRADRELVDALHALFTPAAPEVTNVRRVACRNGMLVLSMGTRAKGDQGVRLAADIAPAVIDAATRLASAHPGTPPPDRLWWRAVLVLALASGLLAHGAIDAFHLVFDHTHDTLDLPGLWWLAGPVAAGVLCVLAALTVALLGRSSRAHLVLVEAMLLAAIGVPLGAMVELRDYNMEADTSAPARYTVHVEGKSVHRSSKGGRTYYVQFGPWPGQPGGYDKVVSSSDFDRFLYGSDATVVIRQGGLGIRWLESATPARW